MVLFTSLSGFGFHVLVVVVDGCFSGFLGFGLGL